MDMIAEAVLKPIIEEEALKAYNNVPPSAKTVYNLIKEKGPITAKDIQNDCRLAPRTVRYALKILLEASLIQRLPNLKDMRQNVYRTTN
jgi:DNA-binding MarR family transcriptional regulator